MDMTSQFKLVDLALSEPTMTRNSLQEIDQDTVRNDSDIFKQTDFY